MTETCNLQINFGLNANALKLFHVLAPSTMTETCNLQINFSLNPNAIKPLHVLACKKVYFYMGPQPNRVVGYSPQMHQEASKLFQPQQALQTIKISADFEILRTSCAGWHFWEWNLLSLKLLIWIMKLLSSGVVIIHMLKDLKLSTSLQFMWKKAALDTPCCWCESFVSSLTSRLLLTVMLTLSERILLLLSQFFKPLLGRTRSRGRCWAAIRLPAPSGRAVHEEVDGLDIGGQHGRRFVLLRHTRRLQRRKYPICTSRSGNAQDRCGGG